MLNVTNLSKNEYVNKTNNDYLDLNYDYQIYFIFLLFIIFIFSTTNFNKRDFFFRRNLNFRNINIIPNNNSNLQNNELPPDYSPTNTNSINSDNDSDSSNSLPPDYSP